MAEDPIAFSGFDTLALHAGQQPDPTTGARAVPIYASTSFVFKDSAHAQRLFDLEELGFIYTRVGNPTQDVLEQRIAALEGGVGALALASGQAASAFSVLGLANAGDNIVASTDLYGGTYTLFQEALPLRGVSTRFVDGRDYAGFAAARSGALPLRGCLRRARACGASGSAGRSFRRCAGSASTARCAPASFANTSRGSQRQRA